MSIPNSARLFGLNQGLIFSELVRLLLTNAHWTREYMLTSTWDPENRQPVQDRLTRSAADMAALYGQLYGGARSADLQKVLDDYNTNAIRFIDAMRAGEQQAVSETHADWSASAERVARLMSEYNRYLDFQTYLAELNNLIFLTEREAYALFSDDYAGSIGIYDEIIRAVVQTAWDLSYATIRLFQG